MESLIQLKLSMIPENEQLSSSLKPGVVVGIEQPKEKKIPPERVSQPMLGMSRRERPNIPPRRMGGPDGGGNGASGRDGDSHDHSNSSNENGGPGWNRDPPDRRGGGPPRENVNPDGGDEVLTLMIVGMGMILHPHQTPHCPEEEDIEDPNMFMYCKGLQGHQTRRGSLDYLDEPEQLAEMGKPCHYVEEALRVQRTNLDTTGLENSFSQFGRIMSDVLKAQQRTNQNLEEQFKRANETQEFQTKAMQDMAQANFQMKFDMFTSAPIYQYMMALTSIPLMTSCIT